jgi:hypothetical protein
MTTAPQNEHYNAPAPVLFLACELRENTWQLGGTLGLGQPPRARPMAARDTQCLRHEVAQATVRCGLGATAPVGSGEAAGRAVGCLVFGRRKGSPILGSMPPPWRSSVARGGPRARRWTSGSWCACGCGMRTAHGTSGVGSPCPQGTRRSHASGPGPWNPGSRKEPGRQTASQGCSGARGAAGPACPSAPPHLRPCGSGLGRPSPGVGVDVDGVGLASPSASMSRGRRWPPSVVPCCAPQRPPRSSQASRGCHAKAAGGRGPGGW